MQVRKLARLCDRMCRKQFACAYPPTRAEHMLLGKFSIWLMPGENDDNRPRDLRVGAVMRSLAHALAHGVSAPVFAMRVADGCMAPANVMLPRLQRQI